MYGGGRSFCGRSAYSTHYSIGWRDGYERGRSVCYCKGLISGEIGKLYEY